MNQFRKCESTTSGECGSTGPPGTIRPVLGSGLQIGAPAGARQHLESLRLLLAIGQRRDRIIIEPVLPIALDIADTPPPPPPRRSPATSRGRRHGAPIAAWRQSSHRRSPRPPRRPPPARPPRAFRALPAATPTAPRRPPPAP